MRKMIMKTNLPHGRRNNFGTKLFACVLLGGLMADPLSAGTLPPEATPAAAAQQDITVTGIVVDALDGSPMIGVNVLIVSPEGGVKMP